MARVFTAPLALIEVDDTVIGKMRSLRVQENYRRGRVVGIGNVKPSEVPLLDFAGSLNCSSYSVNFKNHYLTKLAINRGTDNVVDFVNTILLREEGFSLKVYKKNIASQSNNIIQRGLELYASINGVFINQDGFGLDESGIANHDSGFDFIDPVVYSSTP